MIMAIMQVAIDLKVIYADIIASAGKMRMEFILKFKLSRSKATRLNLKILPSLLT